MSKTFKNETEKHKFLAEIFYGKMKKDELLNLIVETNLEIKDFKKDVVELLTNLQKENLENKIHNRITSFILRNSLDIDDEKYKLK